MAVVPLLGRELELSALEASLGVVEKGRTSVVQLTGEPGIGKTRLLHELAVLARDRGFQVFSARASEFERDVPFAPFIAALDDHLADEGRAIASELGPEQLAELARVFPAVARFAPPRSLLQAERYRAYRACRVLLEMLSRSCPLVLSLDDIHWADPGSAELLGHLLHSRARGAVLLALAFRPQPLPVALAAALEQALRDPDADVQRLQLRALSVDEAGGLIHEYQRAA